MLLHCFFTACNCQINYIFHWNNVFQYYCLCMFVYVCCMFIVKMCKWLHLTQLCAYYSRSVEQSVQCTERKHKANTECYLHCCTNHYCSTSDWSLLVARCWYRYNYAKCHSMDKWKNKRMKSKLNNHSIIFDIKSTNFSQLSICELFSK